MGPEDRAHLCPLFGGAGPFHETVPDPMARPTEPRVSTRGRLGAHTNRRGSPPSRSGLCGADHIDDTFIRQNLCDCTFSARPAFGDPVHNKGPVYVWTVAHKRNLTTPHRQRPMRINLLTTRLRIRRAAVRLGWRSKRCGPCSAWVVPEPRLLQKKAKRLTTVRRE